MNVDGALTLLEVQIDQVARKVNAKQPDRTSEEYILLRALSLGRTYLRLCKDLGCDSTKACEAVYQGARKRIFEEEQS